MDDFTYDVMQRKRLVSGARHRKCGSKSRKCSLSSDQMTQKQWKERCGKVVSYQMGQPMEWNQFKQLPQDVQKMYIDGIMEKYCPTASDLSKVFGVTAYTITKYLGEKFEIKFSPGKKMPKDRIKDFNVFIGRQNSEAELVGVSPESLQASEDSIPSQPKMIVSDQSNSDLLFLSEFSLSFNGKFDSVMIHNSIASIIPNGSDVSIEIHCTLNS